MVNVAALTFDKATVAKIKAVVEHAKNNPITFVDLQKMRAGDLPPPGDIDDFVCTVGDFRCVFSFEYHYNNMYVRHLSVSMGDQAELPNPKAVEMIMVIFGFQSKLMDKGILVEEEKHCNAIAIYEEAVPDGAKH